MEGSGSGPLDVEQALAVLKRRLPLVLLCVILVGGGAFAFSRHQAKRYTATASLVFDNNQLNLQAAGLQAVSSGNQVPQQNTNVKLVQLGDMAQRTAAKLGHGLSAEQIRKDLAVTPQGESNIVDVAATASSPGLAAEIANTYVNQFVYEQQNANHAYYSSALQLVDKQLAALSSRARLSAAGLALQARAQSLSVLAELQSGNVQVAQQALTPTEPSSPKIARNTVLGVVVGLLLGLGLALAAERLDRRLREPQDLERVYGLPLLGAVPESRALSRASGDGLPSADAEAFQLIRAHLRYFNVDRQLRTIMVVSPAPGEGKTTVARHLAAAAAAVGSRVLLMELDLRRPTLASRLGLTPGRGLCDVLIGSASVEQAVQPVDAGPVGSGAGVRRSFDVLLAGSALPPNPAELIESHAMEYLLSRLKPTYDLVVIDTPPLTVVSDAFPLLAKADGVIVVGRLGKVRREMAERLHETLSGAQAPLLGVIANGIKAGALRSYGYSYETKHDEADWAASSNGRSPAAVKG